jgi:hypothetical protein
VAHVILTNPEAPALPYRSIAAEAGVALGTVAIAMTELRRQNYLAPTGHRGCRLERREELQELFVQGYALKLRPACLLGRYRHRESDVETLVDRLGDCLHRHQAPYALTGAAAERFLTGHLRAGDVVLFVEHNRGQQALADEPFLPDAHGNITLLELVGTAIIDRTRCDRHPVATPLLVYAELLADGRPRELEAAELIWNRYLKESPS